MSQPDVSTRRVIGLALPALVVLAAEPLYVLLDTALIGHLGAQPLAALAIGGVVLSQVAGQFNFLAYGTTARAARHFGAGNRERAVREGTNASVLALLIAAAIIVLVEIFAPQIARLIAGSGSPIAGDAASWMRVAILGAPGILLALAGNGWMRGLQRTREPTLYVMSGFGLCLVLLPVLVYGLGWGLLGSAVANVVAQNVVGLLFLRALIRERAPWRIEGAVMRGQLRSGRDLIIRTLALQGSMIVAAAVAARMGTSVIGAHQIGTQLQTLCALALDSVAIAAQALIGAALGSGDRELARRTTRLVARVGLLAGLSFAAVLLVLRPWLPRVFTSDPGVLEQAATMWLFLAGIQVVCGILFALDGVLMGANDVAVLRTITIVAHVAVYLPLALAAYHWQWGIAGIWLGLGLSLLARLLLGLLRLRGEKWMSAAV